MRSLLREASSLLLCGILLSLLRAASLGEPALFHSAVALSVLREQTPLYSWTPSQLGDAVLVDGRSPEEHATLHPVGSLSMPSSRREEALVDLWPRLRARRVAVVMGREDLAASRDLAAFLVRHAGVAMAGTVRGGFEAWRDEGLPCRSCRGQ